MPHDWIDTINIEGIMVHSPKKTQSVSTNGSWVVLETEFTIL